MRWERAGRCSVIDDVVVFSWADAVGVVITYSVPVM
jgi:hypothetical protein